MGGGMAVYQAKAGEIEVTERRRVGALADRVLAEPLSTR
jgi:hypothetical protein